MANGQGGVRIGAGRKKKALADNIADGNPGKRKLTVLETTPGFCNERIHLYLATGLHAGKTHPDEDEFVCTLRMPLSDAVQKVMDGTFRDGKTALALLMVQQLLSAPCKQ